MINNYLVSSHGIQSCPFGNNQTEIISLPENVVVIMNCYNTEIVASAEIDSRIWELAFFDIFTEMKNIKSYTLSDILSILDYYFRLLDKALNFDGNEYCMFVNECPNLLFSAEMEKFRSGFYTLPIKEISYTNKQDLFKRSINITNKDFANFRELLQKYQPKNGEYNNHDIGKYIHSNLGIKGTSVMKFLTPDLQTPFHKFVIESSGVTSKDKYLNKKVPGLNGLIESLNDNIGNNVFHVIIICACTSGTTSHETFRTKISDNTTFALKLFCEKFGNYLMNQINSGCNVECARQLQSNLQSYNIGSIERHLTSNYVKEIEIEPQWMFVNDEWIPFSDNEDPDRLAFDEVQFEQIGIPEIIEYNKYPEGIQYDEYLDNNILKYIIDDKTYYAQKQDNFIIIERFTWSSHKYFNVVNMKFYIPTSNNQGSPFSQKGGKVYIKLANKKHRIYIEGSEPFIRYQKNKLYVKELFHKKSIKTLKSQLNSQKQY
jgi:hypothetical protein